MALNPTELGHWASGRGMFLTNAGTGGMAVAVAVGVVVGVEARSKGQGARRRLRLRSVQAAQRGKS